MTFPTQNQISLRKGSPRELKTYGANGVSAAGDVTFVAHTYCKRETGGQTVEEQRIVVDANLHIGRRLQSQQRRTR